MVDLPGEDGVMIVGGAERPSPPEALPTLESWSFSQAAGWTELGSEGSPQFAESLAYHPPSGRVVAVSYTGTWLYEPTTGNWERRERDDGPLDALGSRMAYDSESDRMILFGGVRMPRSNLAPIEETWAYDATGDAWTQMSPTESPAGRNFHQMAYDVDSDRVILFGGGTETATFADSWAYDFNTDTWVEMAPENAPPPTSYGGVVYDPLSDRVILFGGVTGPNANIEDPLDTTWAYDLEANSWTDVKPATSPSPRGWHAMAYEADDAVIVLFGGGPWRESYNAETWIFDPAANTWTGRSEP